jgi:hypothetical protein
MAHHSSEPEMPLLVGVSLAAPPPVGHLHLELKPGVTALYGRNGVGKTRVLAAVQRLVGKLAAVSDAFDELGRLQHADRWIGVPMRAAYTTGGVHLLSPVGEGDSNSPERWEPSIVKWIRDPYSQPGWGGEDDMDFWPTLRQTVRFAVPAIQLSDEQADYLLRNGRWMLSPGRREAQVLLCDPDTFRGPLAEAWEASDGQWRQIIDRADDSHKSVGPSGLFHYFDGWRLPFHPVHLRIPGLAPPPLPPRPHVVGLQDWPEWAAFPALALTDSGTPPVDVPLQRPISEQSDDPESATAAFFRDDRMFHRTIAGNSFRPEETLSNVETTANSILGVLFSEPPVLRGRARSTNEWIDGRLPFEWTADVGASRGLPLDQLGAAHRRYSFFAIQQSLASASRFDAPFRRRRDISTAFIDEPEAALHNLAVGRVAEGLGQLADVVLVASHSTEIVQTADHRLHAEAGPNGFVTLQPVTADLRSTSLARVASHLGLSVPRLVELTDVVLLVEGPHDEAVIREFLAPELATTLVLMLPLYGTRDLTSVVDSRLLFEATSAPFIVCLDSTERTIEEDLRRLVELRDGQRWSLFHQLRSERRYANPLMKKILEVIRTAIELDQLDRLHIHGFGKADIVRYIDVDLIKPDETASWEQLERAFLSSRNPPASSWGAGMGQEFKAWIGDGYKVPGVERAAAAQVTRWNNDLGIKFHRHEDFSRLGDKIIQLRRDPTPRNARSK